MTLNMRHMLRSALGHWKFEICEIIAFDEVVPHANAFLGNLVEYRPKLYIAQN